MLHDRCEPPSRRPLTEVLIKLRCSVTESGGEAGGGRRVVTAADGACVTCLSPPFHQRTVDELLSSPPTPPHTIDELVEVLLEKRRAEEVLVELCARGGRGS